ncbi:MAG: hypothetical protein ACR2FY_00415 [Pirellulaceae bacterium]
MDTSLLDAAFRLVSPSLSATDADPLGQLRLQFPSAGSQILQDAHARAKRLEEVAIEMADLARGPSNDHSGPPLNEQTLAERCPGFSGESYHWAINDGFTLTR